MIRKSIRFSHSGAANHIPEFTLRESGSPIFLLGGLQFVSDFKQRAREAERDSVYTCNAVKSAKSLLIRLFATLQMRGGFQFPCRLQAAQIGKHDHNQDGASARKQERWAKESGKQIKQRHHGEGSDTDVLVRPFAFELL
jgi:hypothetical protein